MTEPSRATLGESLGALLDGACRQYAGRPATIDWRESLSYAALSARAQLIADDLAAAGAAPDEPVILMVCNRGVDFAAFLGVWRAACVAVPSHLASPPAVLAALIERTGARFIVDDGRVRRLDRAAPPARLLLRGAALVIFSA